jgi:transcriptional regulator with XRE-family HTH domain
VPHWEGGHQDACGKATTPTTHHHHRRPTDVYVGSRLKRQRIILGLTQTELSEMVGVSFQSVQKYERGENRISAGRLHEFATALPVPEQFFFDGIGGEAPEDGPARETPASAAEGKELHHQLSAVLSVDHKRLRGLIIELLKVLSEILEAAPSILDSADTAR